MRVTNNMLINNMIGYIGNNLKRLEKYQYQLATGKKVAVPSDDPVVAARSLKLRTDVAEIKQYKRNVEDAQAWMEITEDTTGSLIDVLQRTRELIVDAANGTKNPDDLKNVNEEIQQLKEQAIHLANTTYAGRYIFSGFKTNKPLLNSDGTFAINIINADEQINFEIGIGDRINVNVVGGDLFNCGNNAIKDDMSALIREFDETISFINLGEFDGINTMLGAIDKSLDNVLKVRADIGARLNRLELTLNRLEDDEVNFTKLLSINEDIDVSEVIINLNNEMNVYNASLSGGAKVIMPTLLDFLR